MNNDNIDENIKLEEKNNVLWNDNLEEFVKDIGELSKKYKIMHIKEAQYLSIVYNNLMILGICLGPISGLLSAIGDILNSTYLPIISMLMGFLSGIIVTIIKFGKYDENSNSNKQSAIYFSSIENNVRRQLGLYRNDRINPITYIDWLETKFENIFNSSPLLPAKLHDKYLINKENEKIDIIKNDQIDDLEKNIQIDENSEKNQYNYYTDKILEYEIKRMTR